MNGDLDVRRAEPGDLDEVVAILSEAARWLLERGIRQWPDPFPHDRVAALLDRGELYLARVGGKPAATFALLWSDPDFWGEQPPVAGYVHVIAVRRAYAGLRLGERLLDWAEAQVAAAGRELLRLDCMRDNEVLKAYYERLGFEPRGEAVFEDFSAMRFERRCRR
jgi:ribosomal protein S18 acetylase RimI-like enzyme